MSDFACRVCGNTDGNTEHSAREMMFGLKDEFPYVQCAACLCLQIQDFPADMSRYYPADGYYSLQDPKRDNPVVHAAKILRNRYAVFGRGWIGKWVEGRVPNIYVRAVGVPGIRKDWRILDVGCGTGEQTLALGDLGFQHVTGIEPFIAADIHYSNGVSIRKGTLHDMDGAWDVIVFHHSLEHMPDPIENLRAAARLLKPGGYVVIAIPVVPCYAWEHYGRDWIAWDAPRHFALHSEKSVAEMARQTGLRIDNVVYNSNSMQFWGSEQYRRGITFMAENSYYRNPAKSSFTPEEIAEWNRRAQVLNMEHRGDQAVFTLRRAGA